MTEVSQTKYRDRGGEEERGVSEGREQGCMNIEENKT